MTGTQVGEGIKRNRGKGRVKQFVDNNWRYLVGLIFGVGVIYATLRSDISAAQKSIEDQKKDHAVEISYLKTKQDKTDDRLSDLLSATSSLRSEINLLTQATVESNSRLTQAVNNLQTQVALLAGAKDKHSNGGQ